MKSPILARAAQQGTRGRKLRACALFCFMTILAFALTASAQQIINPQTTTIQYGGIPNAGNIVSDFTVPRGGIVMYGTAISAFTGKPVRHLWVGDNIHGICRTDPEIDDPAFHLIDQSRTPFVACVFKLNGQSITGGPMAFDPATNFLYLADVRKSQGLFRFHYLPDGDGGHGILDFTDVFAMVGNPTGARFQGGQTGCQIPKNSTLAANPAAGGVQDVTLGPDGNLWVSLVKSGAILRVNNPATATSTGFGTCADFAQVVATSPDNRTVNGLAWIGHDLWGSDGTGAFVIPNADTTCQAVGATPTTSPTCVATNQLAAVPPANATSGDQFFPQLNGNNLYFGTAAVVGPPAVPGATIWAGNIAAGPAGQTVDPTLINPADIFGVPLGLVGAPVVDYTDPANFIIFSGDDASATGAVGVGGALGAGRWWQTCQGVAQALGTFNCPTPAPTTAPGTPTVARAAGGATSIRVSWSAAQSAQPVTSYTVRNTLASNGILLADVIVGPGPSGFPPTSTTISAGLVNTVSYAFSVAATNGNGTSAFSGQSNSATFPTLAKPGIPTSTLATAGDGAALVTWTPPSFVGDAPITSYTATAIANNVVTGITSTVAAPNTSAVVTGLTNGVSYTFSVHATNAGGNSMESTPSDPPVIPATQANQVSVGVTGVSTLGITPVQITYPITIHNNTPFPITSASLSVNLSQVVPDGAFIILVQPSVGTCSGGGLGITLVTCNLGGTLAPLATVSANAIVQIQANGATLTGTFNGIDTGLNPVSAVGSFTTAPAPPPTVTVSAAISVTGNAQVPNPNVGQAGNIVWTISNVTQTRADHVIFTNVLPAGLILNTITFTENNPTNGVLTCVYTPTGGLAVPCPAGAIGSNVGATIQVFAEPGLGGSTKNGAKPPQTLIVTTNVTAPNSHGAVFHPTGTVSFGPGGVDTLPNSATVTITVK